MFIVTKVVGWGVFLRCLDGSGIQCLFLHLTHLPSFLLPPHPSLISSLILQNPHRPTISISSTTALSGTVSPGQTEQVITSLLPRLLCLVCTGRPSLPPWLSRTHLSSSRSPVTHQLPPRSDCVSQHPSAEPLLPAPPPAFTVSSSTLP